MNRILLLVGLYLLGLGVMIYVSPGAQPTEEYKKAEAMYAQTPNIPGQ